MLIPCKFKPIFLNFLSYQHYNHLRVLKIKDQLDLFYILVKYNSNVYLFLFEFVPIYFLYDHPKNEVDYLFLYYNNV